MKHLPLLSSFKRLKWAGLVTAGLACTMALTDIIMNTVMWYTGVASTGYLEFWSEKIPLLLTEGYQLPTLNRVLLVALDFVPVLISSLGLLLTGLFFLRLSRRELWSTRNARLLMTIGGLSILGLVLQPVLYTLTGLVLSLGLPPGEGLLAVSLGLNTESMSELLKAVFVCSFGFMMNEARSLNEEVKAFV